MVVLQANKFFYVRGGAERYMFLLSDALERRGHTVAYLSMTHPSNRDSAYAKYFVEHRDYGVRGLSSGNLRHAAAFVRSAEAERNVLRLVDDVRPDVAHLHNIYHQLTPSIIAALKRRGVPVVMTLHDYKIICPNYTLFAHGRHCERCLGQRYYHAATTRCSGGSFMRGVLLAVEAYWQHFTGVYDGVDRFIAPSRFMRDTVIRAGVSGDRVTHLTNFAPLAGDVTDSLSEADRAAMDELPSRYVLYFGRLSGEKGLDVLFDSMVGLPDTSLVVAGDGPDAEKLRRRAESELSGRVHFTGYAGRAFLGAVVSGAAAVVMPSEWSENAPYGVLEAVGAGVPVIVSDAGGLPELAQAFGGWMFPRSDSVALAARIREAWDDPVGARARGLAGRESLVGTFAEDGHATAIESIYQDVIDGNRGVLQ